MLIYFYIPIFLDSVKFLLGRDDLSYGFVIKADYVIFNPKQNGFSYIIYTALSRFYINYFLMEFHFLDIFLMTLFFYVGSYMEGVKLRLKLLAEEIDLREMKQPEQLQRLKQIIDNHSTSIWMVKTLDVILRFTMLAQFVLFSLSFCLILFNFTLVIFCASSKSTGKLLKRTFL